MSNSNGKLNGESLEVVRARIRQRIEEQEAREMTARAEEVSRAEHLTATLNALAFVLGLGAVCVFLFLPHIQSNFVAYSWLVVTSCLSWFAGKVVQTKLI